MFTGGNLSPRDRKSRLIIRLIDNLLGLVRHLLARRLLLLVENCLSDVRLERLLMARILISLLGLRLPFGRLIVGHGGLLRGLIALMRLYQPAERQAQT